MWMRSSWFAAQSSKGISSGGLSLDGDEGEGVEQGGMRERKLMRKIFL